MALATPRACRCGAVIPPGQRCQRCNAGRQKRTDERRGTAHQRGYDSDWRRLRALVLSEEPICRECEKHGRYVPADDVDHITPHQGYGDPKRLDRSNLQPLCKACHSKKTAREDGGFGNRRSL